MPNKKVQNVTSEFYFKKISTTEKDSPEWAKSLLSSILTAKHISQTHE